MMPFRATTLDVDSIVNRALPPTGCRQRPVFPGRLLLILAIVFCISVVSGCGTLAQIMYVVQGHKIDAKYDGLKGKRVAVVCVSDASAYGPDTLTYTIANSVSYKLATVVKKIEMVQPSDVERWVDTNGWDERDYVELGRGVDADLVLAIEISSYSIHEGSTMYKGRADLTATVINVGTENASSNGVEFILGPEHYAFPESGRPAIQTSPRQFEALYLAKLTQHIARQFYDYDELETVAEDATLIR